jgi:DNA modification methylase
VGFEVIYICQKFCTGNNSTRWRIYFIVQNTTIHRLINGDARDLSFLPDESVHLVITSPPYWNLKKP